MKKISVFAPFLILLTFSGCSQDKKIIALSNIKNNISIPIPIEIDIGEIRENNKTITARSLIDKEYKFTLQKTPPLFFSENDSLKQTYCAILPAGIREGKYEIVATKNEPCFSFSEKTMGKLTIIENENPILTYNYGMLLSPGVPERYKRSTYIHPVFDLDGNELTDDFPSDHFHHRGLSWMWPKVFINDKRYDLWHIYGQSGELDGIHQVFEEWLVKETGPVCATIAVKNRWELDDHTKVMDEWVQVRVFKTTELGRTIDLSFTWKAADPVKILGQTQRGYGGLNFRFAPRQETIITTPAGVEAKDSDLLRYAWADQSGKFAEQNYFSGLSIFQHQNNVNFPAGWCLRYYGFLGVAWPGLEPVTVEEGKSITLQFRILVHRGNAEDGKVKVAYEVFRNPPVITFD